jgi:hypothetical protein
VHSLGKIQNMSDTKISEDLAVTYLDGDEIFPVLQSDINRSVDVKMLSKRITPTFNPHDYGAKGDAISMLDAVIAGDLVTITSAQYTFKDSDVGKECHISDGWQTGGYRRVIGSVVAGAGVLSVAATSAGSNKAIIIGTDDTLAIEAAFDAAAKSMLTVQQLGKGADPVSWGAVPSGGTVKLASGRGYLVRNTQERYDAGKIAAIMVPRHCGLEGSGVGQTGIYLGYGNIGHGIANWSAASPGGDERIHLSDFSLFCNRANQPAECLDGIYFYTSFGNYTNTDNFSMFYNIQIYQARRNGLFANTRGEVLYYGLWAMNCKEAGFYFENSLDSRIMFCNAGGNGYSGFDVAGAQSSEFNGCKSFYNGAAGGTSQRWSANWYISDGGHSYLKGSCIFVGCESQESRGSGFFIEGGINQFVGCLASDPKRAGIGGNPRPAVCAGFHIDKNASNNVFSGCYARASLGLDWGTSTENHYGGDYAVYIGYQNTGNAKTTGPRGNKGHIYTLEPSTYNVSKLGGLGVTNGLNGGLYIDGDALPTSIPNAPTLNSVVFGETATAVLSITAPSVTGGRNITDYKIEYKLDSEPTVWTDYYHFPSSSPSAHLIAAGVLTDSLTYDIRVAAVNNNGKSNWSNIVSFDNTPSVPAKVSGVTCLVSSAIVYLSWTAPATGGSVITDYKVEYKLNSEPTTWTTFSDGVSTAVTATVTGLTNSSLYDFRVSAINAVGTGVESDTASATPLAMMSNIYDASILGYYNSTVDSSVVDGGDGVIESFTDLSGRANNSLTQSTASRKPSKGIATIGTGAAIDFDGAEDYFILPTYIKDNLADGDFTMVMSFQLKTGGLAKTNALISSSNGFLVYIRASDAVPDIVAKCGVEPGANIAFTPDTNPHIIAIRRTGTNITFWLDGVQSSTSTASNVTATTINLGTENIYYGQIDAKVGVLAFYNSSISTTKINNIIAQCDASFGTTSTTIA